MHILHFPKTCTFFMEALLILNKFSIYKTLCIQVKITKKKNKKNKKKKKKKKKKCLK